MFGLRKPLSLSCALLLLVGSTLAHGWTYPLDQVSKPKTECKSAHWSTLKDDCKMDLPIIADADYTKYLKDWTTQVIYSDIWGGSYNDGWDFNNGGAPSTDIATAEGTPVFSIGKGKVIFAGELAGYGNSVTVEHDMGNGKKVWSSYSHLSKIIVKQGELISEGTLIGEVGKTGFTIGPFGYHLDFAITTTKQKNYPYAYYDCKSGYMSAVQNGVCRELLAKNTIDPILFLELDGNLNKAMEIAQTAITKKQEVLSNALATTSNATKTNGTSSTTSTTAPTTPKAKNTRIINQKIFEIEEEPLVIEIVDLQREQNESLTYKGKAYITVAVTKDGKPYDGYLNKELSFVSKNKVVGIGGGLIDYIKGGEKTVILYGDKKGEDVISVKLGNEIIGIHQTSVQ